MDGWKLVVLEAHAERCERCRRDTRRGMLVYLREERVVSGGRTRTVRRAIHARCSYSAGSPRYASTPPGPDA
jgi:hypothetical protein